MTGKGPSGPNFETSRQSLTSSQAWDMMMPRPALAWLRPRACHRLPLPRWPLGSRPPTSGTRSSRHGPAKGGKRAAALVVSPWCGETPGVQILARSSPTSRRQWSRRCRICGFRVERAHGIHCRQMSNAKQPSVSPLSTVDGAEKGKGARSNTKRHGDLGPLVYPAFSLHLPTRDGHPGERLGWVHSVLSGVTLLSASVGTKVRTQTSAYSISSTPFILTTPT